MFTRRARSNAVAGLDPDRWLAATIRELYPEFRSTPYRAVEDLAEQGVKLLAEFMDGEEIWYGRLFGQVEEANRQLDPPAAPEAS